MWLALSLTQCLSLLREALVGWLLGGTFYIHLAKTSFSQRGHFTCQSLAKQAHFTLNLWPNRPILH